MYSAATKEFWSSSSSTCVLRSTEWDPETTGDTYLHKELYKEQGQGNFNFAKIGVEKPGNSAGA